MFFLPPSVANADYFLYLCARIGQDVNKDTNVPLQTSLTDLIEIEKMKKLYYVMLAALTLTACGKKANDGATDKGASENDSVTVVAEAGKESALKRVVKVTRGENVVPIEGATEEDEKFKYRTMTLEYDDDGRVAMITIDAENESTAVTTFDYNKPGKVISMTSFEGEDYEPDIKTYYLNNEGYVTKVEQYGSTYTFKYKDGHVVECTAGDCYPIKATWKDGNMVKVERYFDEVGSEVTNYTYTNIPIDVNYDYTLSFNWFGVDYIDLVSKGFTTKNFVETMVNDQPIEDDFKYETDKNGKVKKVLYHRCGDNYNSDADITVEVK